MNTEKTIADEKAETGSEPKFKKSLLKLVLPGILIIGAVAWVWHDFLKDRFIPVNFSVVEEGMVYRSGRISAGLIKKTLVKYKMGVIVDLAADKGDDINQNAEKNAAAELNIKRLVLPLKGDGTGDINNYASSIAAIVEARRAKTPILVHCAGGAQRTGGVIAAYQLLVEQKAPSLVLKELKHHKWRTNDTALTEYLNSNMKQLAELLYQMHVIERIPSPLPQLPQEEK
jgi:protein-tyrosine phosphatase